MKQPPTIKITDADGLARLVSMPDGVPTLLVLDISKRDIQTGNIASALERLHILTDTRASVLRFRESLIFRVAGDDADRRELPEVPEVRTFFRTLTDQWPHWPWFLARGMGSLGLLTSLLCEVQIVRGRGKFGTEFRDAQELLDRFHDLIRRQEPLFEAMGIDDAAVQDSYRSAAAELFI